METREQLTSGHRYLNRPPWWLIEASKHGVFGGFSAHAQLNTVIGTLLVGGNGRVEVAVALFAAWSLSEHTIPFIVN